MDELKTQDKGIIKASFLGEEYTFPAELAQYVIYGNEFEKMNDRLMGHLLDTMKKSPMLGDDSSYTDMREKFEGYMQDEGCRFIMMLSEIGVYDVTESDVIYSNKGYMSYANTKIKMNTGSAKILSNAIGSWMDEQDSIYRSAASNITGSGYSLWSNSFLAHATFAAMEYSTLKQQAKKADKQYQQAMDELNSRCNSRMDRNYARFYASEIYPEIANDFNMFTTELMTIYLTKIDEKGIYDSSKILNYDFSRSSELLKNIRLVRDKRAVLKEAFKSCPFNPDVYAAVLEYGFFDVETLKTAKKFHQENILNKSIEREINKHANNIEEAKEYIEVLAYYTGKDEKTILKHVFEKEILEIKNTYREIDELCVNNKKMDTWIFENISPDMDIVLKIPFEKIESILQHWLDEKLPDKRISELTQMDFIDIKEFGLKKNLNMPITEWKMEYKEIILKLISDYIKEANRRKEIYETAYKEYNDELNKRKKILNDKSTELAKQGVFAFSNKKRLKTEIEQIKTEIAWFEKKEPIEKKNAYYQMYS